LQIACESGGERIVKIGSYVPHHSNLSTVTQQQFIVDGTKMGGISETSTFRSIVLQRIAGET